MIQFTMLTSVGPRNHVLHGCTLTPPGEDDGIMIYAATAMRAVAAFTVANYKFVHYQSISAVITALQSYVYDVLYIMSSQLSLLPSAGREMSTGQRAVMLCGWGVEAGWFSSRVDKRVSGR